MVIKVLVIGKYYAPFMGGIEDNTAAIARGLARAGHQVTALVNAHQGNDSEELMDGVRVIRRKPWATISNQPVAPHLLKGVDLSQFDLVHFHAPNPFANALLLYALLRTKKRPAIIVTHHMDINGRPGLRELSRVLYASLVRKSKLVVVTSIKNARVSNDLPADAPLAAIPLGASPEKYVLDARGKEAARAWRRDLAGEAPLIGFLGRHARYKGLDVLVKALAEMPGVHLAVAGDGPYRKPAEALAVKLAVADRVHFLGGIDHATKLKLLSSIDVYAFPSTEITEAFGISQLEAMLCGAPVVASELPTGVTDVSVDGLTALTCTPSDVGDLVDKLNVLLNDRQLAGRLAKRARAHVLANMTAAKIEGRTCSAIVGAMAMDPA